jgi:hypothetical protein
MKHYLTAAAAVVLLALSSGAVRAQDEGDIVGSLTEGETTKVGKFGKGVGQAYICADESARPEMLEDIRLIFNFVSQDMGTDAAFLYAIALGFGAGETAAGHDCAKLLTKWGEVREEFDLKEEGE